MGQMFKTNVAVVLRNMQTASECLSVPGLDNKGINEWDLGGAAFTVQVGIGA